MTSCCTLFAAQYYPVGLAPEASRFFTFLLILFVVHSFVSVPPCLSFFSCPGFSVAGVTDGSRQDGPGEALQQGAAPMQAAPRPLAHHV